MIKLDLRRDLPKVRKSFKRLAAYTGGCLYSTPCAVGVMMTPAQRRALADWDSYSITSLIDRCLVSVPADQKKDFQKLQRGFDMCTAAEFERRLEELERKYAPVLA